MDFLKLFLRGISLLPSLVQSLEALYGAKSGAQKKDAALAIVSSSLNMADAVTSQTDRRRAQVHRRPLPHRRRRRRMPQRQPVGEVALRRINRCPIHSPS
jgi:hypothetical protein